jgi:hypothetical protein
MNSDCYRRRLLVFGYSGRIHQRNRLAGGRHRKCCVRTARPRVQSCEARRGFVTLRFSNAVPLFEIPSGSRPRLAGVRLKNKFIGAKIATRTRKGCSSTLADSLPFSSPGALNRGAPESQVSQQTPRWRKPDSNLRSRPAIAIDCSTFRRVFPTANGCQFHAATVEWHRSAAAAAGSNQKILEERR